MSNIFNDSEQTRIRSSKDLLETYLSPLFYDKHSTTAIVAGGFFASAIQSEKIKDIDIYFAHPKVRVTHTDTGIRNMFPNITTLTQSPVTEYGFNENIKQVWNANVNNSNMNYQLIFTSYNSREEIIADFDYRHCCVSYSVMDKKLYISRSTYDAIINKDLVVNNPKMVSSYRWNKFINKGYSDKTKGITNELSKMASYTPPIYPSIKDYVPNP